MMNSAARLLTRRSAVAVRRLQVVRTFAVAPVTSQAEEQNLVRQSIQRLLEHYQQEIPSSSTSSMTKRSITDEVLEKAVQACQNQAEEARLCIVDCQEAPLEELAEEFQTADLAIEEAVAALVDLLDGLRHASDSQQERYVACREEYASKIKELRQTLEDLKLTATVS